MGQGATRLDNERLRISIYQLLPVQPLQRLFVCNRVELLNDGTIHPTQKPVKLYSWVLSLFARKGMKILDTHAGSGSSLIACYRQGGLDFVGFEIDEDYCRAAQARLEQEQAQMRLFDLLEQEQRKAQITIFNE